MTSVCVSSAISPWPDWAVNMMGMLMTTRWLRRRRALGREGGGTLTELG